jgi:hypothetical protein
MKSKLKKNRNKTIKNKRNRNNKNKTNKIYKGGLPVMMAASFLKTEAGKKMASDMAGKALTSGKEIAGKALTSGKEIAGKAGAAISGAVSKITPSRSQLLDTINKAFLTLFNVLGAIVSVPVRNLDEIIPNNLCTSFMQNGFVCNQSLLQYLFTGSKSDYKKILIDNDKCIQYDETGNKIVECKNKISGGSVGRINGGSMIISCKTGEKETPSSPRPRTGSSNLNDSKLNQYIEKKLKLILKKLIKVNLYLRKYECPKDKLESLIKKIGDLKILKKILELCNQLIGTNSYKANMEGISRTKQCDTEYKNMGMESKGSEYILKTKIDTKYLTFFKEDDSEANSDAKSCKSCSMPWVDLFGKYACFVSSSLSGSSNNINYILLSILQDMATIENEDYNESTVQGIIINIKGILQNIECRSDLREILKIRIAELEKAQILKV